jgi:transposase
VYRIHLTEAPQEELFRRTRAADLKPRTRDRLEMVRLVAAGMSIPQAAQTLRVSQVRVRHWIKQFLAHGFDALPDQPHPGQRSQLTPELLAAVREEIAKGERSWTAPQLVAWLAEQHGVRLTPNHLCGLLKRAGLSYRRTERSLQHKQDPAQVAQQRAALHELEKGGTPGSGTWRT